MSSLPWDFIRDKVQTSAAKQKRSVTVVAVTKGQSPEKIQPVLSSSHPPHILGESYLAESLEKRKRLAGLQVSDVQWHFLGRLQSRKIEAIAESFSCLHAVGRLKEVEALAELARCPEFFLQVNTSGEKQKNGFLPDELPHAIEVIYQGELKAKLLGLMCLPAPIQDVGEKNLRAEFSLLRKLRDRHLPGKKLNMGTSGDFEIAIEEGADWIRLGTVIFGEREK
jgi:pyridoxal phosphate enzyme (YggS family)